jgi:lipid II:glycine glycyltransferase (peptidoglycan interpeptide bridge formation enzyme)
MNHGLPPEDWDARLQQLGGGILQSRAWAQVQQALGREVYWDSGEGWCWLAALRTSRGLRYLLCNYGPVGQGAALRAAVHSLTAAGRELGADLVRIEPTGGLTPAQLRQLGARQIAEVDPQYTRVVDLRLDEAELRSGLASSHRNNVNGTERRGIQIRQSRQPEDYREFLAMLHDTARRAKVNFHPDDYYQALHDVLAPLGIAKFYLAEVEGQPVAAALFYDWGSTRYYAHAGAYQQLNRKVRASVSLVWQALIDAKADGLVEFDLWGIAPEGDRQHRLAGLSEFKAGFGGRQVEYLGTWDIPLKPAKYRLYSAYRRLRGRA